MLLCLLQTRIFSLELFLVSSRGSSGVMISRNLKNVLVVSVGFLFLFTAYGGLQNLQVSRTPRRASEGQNSARPPARSGGTELGRLLLRSLRCAAEARFDVCVVLYLTRLSSLRSALARFSTSRSQQPSAEQIFVHLAFPFPDRGETGGSRPPRHKESFFAFFSQKRVRFGSLTCTKGQAESV